LVAKVLIEDAHNVRPIRFTIQIPANFSDKRNVFSNNNY
jgi:hypothetical protein